MLICRVCNQNKERRSQVYRGARGDYVLGRAIHRKMVEGVGVPPSPREGDHASGGRSPRVSSHTDCKNKPFFERTRTMRQTSSLRLSSAEFREKFCPLFLPMVGAGWNYASNPKREAKKQGVRIAYPLLFVFTQQIRTLIISNASIGHFHFYNYQSI